MAALYNDGTVQYGSRALYVTYWDTSLTPDAYAPRGVAGGSGTALLYQADNITINRPTKAVDRSNQLGEPSGSVGIADFVTGSITFQLGSSSYIEPQLGDKIVFTEASSANATTGANVHLDGTIGDESFFITSVSRAEVKDQEIKISVNIKKAYGA